MKGKEYFAAAFGLVSQPVVAVQNGSIEYMNPAAQSQFGAQHVGNPAATLLPEHILEAQAGSFVAGAEIAGKCCTVRTCTIEKARVFFIESELDPQPAHTALLAAMRSNLANIKIAADRISDTVSPAKGSNLEQYSSALSHNYYQLKRLVVNLSAAEGILSDSLVFSPCAIDLTSLCADIVSAVASLGREKNIDVKFECAKRLTTVADSELVELMLLNLLSNSLLHMPAGGRIKVSLSEMSSYITLTVTDSGMGIPPEELNTVFSKYRQTAILSEMNEGAGLGLTVARGIAERHDGVMIIESTPGVGTTVRVTLSKRLSSNGTFKSAEEQYSPKGMDEVLTQLSTWLSQQSYIKEFQD